MTGTLTNTGWIIQCHVLLSYPQILLTTKKLSLNEVLDLISKVCACAQLWVGVTMFYHDIGWDMWVCVYVWELVSLVHTRRHTYTLLGTGPELNWEVRERPFMGRGCQRDCQFHGFCMHDSLHSTVTHKCTHTHTHTHTHMEDSILPAENTHHMEVYPPIAMYCQHTYTKPIYAHSMWTLAYSQHKHDFSKEHDFS